MKAIIYLKKFIFYIIGIFGILLGIGALTISYTFRAVNDLPEIVRMPDRIPH